MIQQAIDYIGVENLETAALCYHRPIEGNYVIVNNARDYKIISRDRMQFNSKLNGMDYYSQLVSMNKPVKSKLITSNNYLTFFVKNVQKLKDADVDDYFSKLELPENREWHRQWVKDNIGILAKTCKGVIKIFFPGSRIEYRELGMCDWYEKSITVPSYIKNPDREKGCPISYNANAKKSYLSNKFNTFMVGKQEALNYKMFYDILKGMYRQGYRTTYICEKRIIPLYHGELPKQNITGAIIFAFRISPKGMLEIMHMDSVPAYTWYL